MRSLGRSLLSLFGVACASSGGADPLVPDGLPAACDGSETYPPGAVEPMALGEVLSPYAWPEAIHRGTRARTRLDLALAPCATDPDIDWSPFDVLLFVSIPAW